MPRTLHIFVDESGQHHRGDCYTVAACWCVSERSDAASVLKPTKLRLMETLKDLLPNGNRPSELKSSSLRVSEVTQLVQRIEPEVYRDSTIISNRLPWNHACPLQVSLHDVNPNLGMDTLAGVVGELQAPDTIQLLSLASVLNPAFALGRLDHSRYEDIQIWLDGGIWQQTANRLENGVENIDALPDNLTCNIKDSKAVPGIQLADLVANTWYRHLIDGNCDSATGSLQSIRLSNQ